MGAVDTATLTSLKMAIPAATAVKPNRRTKSIQQLTMLRMLLAPHFKTGYTGEPRQGELATTVEAPTLPARPTGSIGGGDKKDQIIKFRHERLPELLYRLTPKDPLFHST